MADISVKTNRIYVDRPLRPDEISDERYEQGKPPVSDPHDTELESHDHRRHFQENDGDISIIVEAGDELGDIGVCVQYEGQIVGDNKDLGNQCVSKQEDVFDDAAGWLHDILSRFETDWDADIYSVPCPVAEKKLEVREAIRRLEGVRVNRHEEVDVKPAVAQRGVSLKVK